MRKKISILDMDVLYRVDEFEGLKFVDIDEVSLCGEVQDLSTDTLCSLEKDIQLVENGKPSRIGFYNAFSRAGFDRAAEHQVKKMWGAV